MSEDPQAGLARLRAEHGTLRKAGARGISAIADNASSLKGKR